MSFFLERNPFFQRKLRQYPQLLNDNKSFWDGLVAIHQRAQCVLADRAYPPAPEVVGRELTQPVKQYLEQALLAYRRRWGQNARPYHPSDVRQVWLEKRLRELEGKQKQRVPLLRDELKRRLSETVGWAGPISNSDRGQLLELFDELQAGQGPIHLPLRVQAEEVIFILAEAISNLNFERRDQAALRAVKRRKKAKGRRLAEVSLKEELTEKEKEAIGRYVTASLEARELEGFEDDQRQTRQRGRTKPRQDALRQAVRSLHSLFRSKTHRPFPLIHALLDHAGLLGEIHRDPCKALAAIRKLAGQNSSSL